MYRVWMVLLEHWLELAARGGASDARLLLGAPTGDQAGSGARGGNLGGFSEADVGGWLSLVSDNDGGGAREAETPSQADGYETSSEYRIPERTQNLDDEEEGVLQLSEEERLRRAMMEAVASPFCRDPRDRESAASEEWSPRGGRPA